MVSVIANEYWIVCYCNGVGVCLRTNIWTPFFFSSLHPTNWSERVDFRGQNTFKLGRNCARKIPKILGVKKRLRCWRNNRIAGIGRRGISLEAIVHPFRERNAISTFRFCGCGARTKKFFLFCSRFRIIFWSRSCTLAQRIRHIWLSWALSRRTFLANAHARDRRPNDEHWSHAIALLFISFFSISNTFVCYKFRHYFQSIDRQQRRQTLKWTNTPQTQWERWKQCDWCRIFVFVKNTSNFALLFCKWVARGAMSSDTKSTEKAREPEETRICGAGACICRRTVLVEREDNIPFSLSIFLPTSFVSFISSSEPSIAIYFCWSMDARAQTLVQSIQMINQ